MSLSNSRLAYTDCYTLLDQALDEPRGIRAEVANYDAANYLRMRIHHARTIDRRDNTRTYPDPNEPMHGRSAYDVLVCRIEEDGDNRAWVYLDKQKVEIGRIESIPEGKQIEFVPQKLLEGPKAEEPWPLKEPSVKIEMVPVRPQIRRR